MLELFRFAISSFADLRTLIPMVQVHPAGTVPFPRENGVQDGLEYGNKSYIFFFSLFGLAVFRSIINAN